MPSLYTSVMVKTDPVGTQSGPVTTTVDAARAPFSITVAPAGVTTLHAVSSGYSSVPTVTVRET